MQSSDVVSKDEFSPASTGKIAMWLFLVIDGLSFATILVGAMYLRVNGSPWPQPGQILNVPLTTFNTFVLIISSFTMIMALDAIQKDDRAKSIKFIILTILAGLIFLGIQAYEYTHFILGSEHLKEALASAGINSSKFWPSTSVFASCFYGATGFHGLHVLSGVIFLLYILIRTIKGQFSAKNYDRVEIATIFWHFVDLMWILVFTFVYLI